MQRFQGWQTQARDALFHGIQHIEVAYEYLGHCGEIGCCPEAMNIGFAGADAAIGGDHWIGGVAVHVDFRMQTVLVRLAEMHDLAQIMDGDGAALDGLELLEYELATQAYQPTAARFVFRIQVTGITQQCPCTVTDVGADGVTTTDRRLAPAIFHRNAPLPESLRLPPPVWATRDDRKWEYV